MPEGLTVRNVHLLTTSALRATSSAWFQTEIRTLTKRAVFQCFFVQYPPSQGRKQRKWWRRQQGGRCQQLSPPHLPGVAQPCQHVADPRALLFHEGMDASLKHRDQSEQWNVLTTARELRRSHFCKRHNAVNTAPSLRPVMLRGTACGPC